ncbi:MAG: VOC family protein [bacterium]|nr:VOC family protein [bacterium]
MKRSLKYRRYNGCLTLLLACLAGAPAFGGEGDHAVQPARIFDIGIYVEDLDRTAAFYEKVFGLRVQQQWESMTNFGKDGSEQEAKLAGIYMGGDDGPSLEFLERADVAARQQVQEPINHFALAVDDVEAALDRALAAGAKLAFPDQRLFNTQAGDMLVVHTQIIGLDGERIQILRQLK